MQNTLSNLYSHWPNLPDLLLENIFSYLSIQERYYASLVCVEWNAIFAYSGIWKSLIIDDHTLTRKKFNYYLGYQDVLDHERVHTCLLKIGKYITSYIFKPMKNFFNLYEFMNLVSHFIESNLCSSEQIKSLSFTFNCHFTEGDKDLVFGTGGQFLDSLKRLMANLKNLKYLELNDLLLEEKEAIYLLDQIAYNCCETLICLKIMNCTKTPLQILHIGTFINLENLTISPQNLGDDVIELLSFTKIKNLCICYNNFTEFINNVSKKSWILCKKNNSLMRVHFLIEADLKREIDWQDEAPVVSIVFNSSFITASASLLSAIQYYSESLEIYGHFGLPKYFMPKSYNHRSDWNFILMCRLCNHLRTLVIRERISTCTVLLIAHYARNLKQFFVRKNAIILKADWPHMPEWSKEFYKWLCNTAKSYDRMENAVSAMLGYTWHALSDKEYKFLNLKIKRLCEL